MERARISPLVKTIVVIVAALVAEFAIFSAGIASEVAVERCNNGWDSPLCSDALAPVLAVAAIVVAFFAFLACCAFWREQPEDDLPSADRPRE